MTEPIDMHDWIARKVQELNAEVVEFLATHIPLSAEDLHEIIIRVFEARMNGAITESICEEIADEQNQFAIKRILDQAYKSALNENELRNEIADAIQEEVGDFRPWMPYAVETHQIPAIPVDPAAQGASSRP